MAKAEKYFIGPNLLGDIRRVVGRVDAEPIASDITGIPTRLQEMRPRGGGLRIVTFTGGWAKTTLKTVLHEPTTATMTVSNIFATITNASCSRKGAAAKIGGKWYLISAEGG